MFETLHPRQALGVHWGTFQLTFESIAEPRQRLEILKRRRGIAPNRFLVTEVGRVSASPDLQPARS